MSKCDLFCVKHEELCISNEELCISNDELCSTANAKLTATLKAALMDATADKQARDKVFYIENHGLCIENHGLCIENDGF